MASRSKKPSRKSLVEEFLRLHPPAEITAETLAALRRYVSEALGGATVSEKYLLDLLDETPLPIARELGGLPPALRRRVHFHDFAAAEASLLDLCQEHSRALLGGDRERAADCGRAVLRGKQRLEMLLRQRGLPEPKRAEKQEILEWFRVWLETPDLFPDWLALRQRARGRLKP